MPEILNKSVAEGGSSENADKIRLKIPLKGETDWALLLRKCFEEIAEHKHEGSGDGQLIQTSGIEPNAITKDLILADAVETVKIKDLNVTTSKIADDGVTYAKIQNIETANTVLGSTSADGIVTETKVLTAMIQDSNVTTAKIADDNITVDKKKTTEIETMSDPQVLNTGLASDKSFIIHYRIKDGSNFQIGTLSGVSNSCLVDEFVGADLEASFDFNGNDIEINGASGKDLQYSIEFLE